jgi:hypothetical protein
MDNIFVATWWCGLGDWFGNCVRGNQQFEAISRDYW